MLDDDLLARIHDRAARVDRENVFPWEDLEDLKAAGYLAAMVPAERGGGGLSLPEMVDVQRRLAAASPATALAVNMHQVWVGVARVMAARGDHHADFLFDAALAGELFAFGISEAGNDLVLMGSDTQARPDGDGGYRFHGRKIFTSLAPAWTMLGTFGIDSTSPDAPKSVFAFVGREGTETKDDWDTMGMRASQSCSTILDGAHATADRVIARIDPGPTPHPVMLGIFANFTILIASVYTGLAERALELAGETVAKRTSKMHGGAPYSNDPDIRWRIASAGIALDAIPPQLHWLASAIDEVGEAEHGAMLFPRLSALKVRATETAKLVVEEAIRSCGGSSYFAGNELSRLYRDVLAGLFHPSDDESTHNSWANALLGPVVPWPPADGDAARP